MSALEKILGSQNEPKKPEVDGRRPSDVCPECGCAIWWRDSYGGWHCAACRPAAVPAMVRGRAGVLVGPNGDRRLVDLDADGDPVHEVASGDSDPLPDGWRQYWSEREGGGRVRVIEREDAPVWRRLDWGKRKGA